MKATLVFIMLLAAVYGRAISLTGTYVQPGGDIYGVTSMGAPSTVAGGGDLKTIFDTAANAWNSKIGDNWSLNIKYGWSNTIGNAVAQYYAWWMPFGDQRHFQARILFNPNYSFYADATPGSHSEYQSYSESSRNYGSGEMNIGRNFSNATGEAAGRFDLLTLATHEIGHALSIGVGPRWTNEIADGNITLTAPRYYAGSIIPIDATEGHLAEQTSLMWYGLAPGERKLISELDLDTGMQVSGFTIRPVPEPTTMAVIAAGLGFLIRRKRKNS